LPPLALRILELELRFQRLGDGLEMAMERHLFRLHRRQVAEARRAR
ncbi:MAG TPA: hypothetical protein DIW85_14540, partial [Stenotrophomonas sp.]|nr:hypothetical protein [Stenotrophomonas sp.]